MLEYDRVYLEERQQWEEVSLLFLCFNPHYGSLCVGLPAEVSVSARVRVWLGLATDTPPLTPPSPVSAAYGHCDGG